MKQTALLFTWIAMLFASAFAGEMGSAKKYYCDTQQIELTETMILVHLPEGTFEADALLADQGGLYITEEALRCIECRRPVNPRNICECPVAQARFSRLAMQ